MPRSICGNCRKIFSSTTAFDHHRVGDYGSPVYETEQQRRSRKGAQRYTHHTRRCMTTDEMRSGDFAVEMKTITVVREGQNYLEECEVWFEPEARENLRRAYGNDESAN